MPEATAGRTPSLAPRKGSQPDWRNGIPLKKRIQLTQLIGRTEGILREHTWRKERHSPYGDRKNLAKPSYIEPAPYLRIKEQKMQMENGMATQERKNLSART